MANGPASELERIRDVPRFCACRWGYLKSQHRWQRVAWARGCPVHHRAATPELERSSSNG